MSSVSEIHQHLMPSVSCLLYHAFCVCNVITLNNQFLLDLFLITAVTKSGHLMQMLKNFIETRTAISQMIIVC